MELSELPGTELGERELRYEERDVMLYALCVGAAATDLDLVYEVGLRALPTYACALGLWATEAAGDLGAYDRLRSLHATQRLVMHRPMPAAGRFTCAGRVTGAWDKGKATIVDVEVHCDVFTASYGIYLPGIGGWGGERGPSAKTTTLPDDAPFAASHRSSPDQAARYRLTGDRHPIHIDPATAQANGFDRPILHGLCTLGIAVRALAGAAGAHPADLSRLEARLSGVVMPGDVLDVRGVPGADGDGISFAARVADRAVLSAGHATFAGA